MNDPDSDALADLYMFAELSIVDLEGDECDRFYEEADLAASLGHED